VSVEFCGGTHLASTKDCGEFAVVSEEAVAKGIRRVVALTGVPARAAIQSAQNVRARVGEAAKLVGEALQREVADLLKELEQMTMPVAAKDELRKAIAGLQEKLKAGNKEAAAAAKQAAVGLARQIADSALTSGDRVIVTGIDLGSDRGALEQAASKYQEGLPVALLTTTDLLDDAQLHIRLALLAASGGDHAAMDEHFRSALAYLREAGASAPVWYIVAECSALCGAIGRVHLAEQFLSRMINDAIEGGAVPMFRGKLAAAIPGDWLAKESTTVIAPDGQANVIASSEPLDPSIDIERFAAIQGEHLKTGFREYDEKSFDRVEIFGGRSALMRKFQWTPQDGAPVMQLQLYYTERGRAYTATATAPAESFPARELQLRQILWGCASSTDSAADNRRRLSRP
jgi:hypothetical protein